MPLQFLVVFCAGWVNRRQQAVIEYLRTENAVLKEALGGRPRLDNRQRRRLAVAGKELGRGVLAEVAGIATPDTILRWWRTLVAQKYDGTTARGPGRPRVRESIASLIVRIATENPGFGYTRIRDAIENLERTVARSTVKRVLEREGIVPAPERRRKVPWRDFLATHLDGLFGGDFFTVEVLTLRGLVRYHVLFFMEIKTRRVHVAGVTTDPTQAWLLQVARNLTDAYDGFLRNARHVILDRDPLFTAAFRRVLEDRGVDVLRLPRRSPNLNAYCERWVRSIRTECLDRIVPLGERHLVRAISEFVVHYHRERNHQALDGALIDPEPTASSSSGRVLCRMRLGGLLRYYYRSAA
ncbi:MAG: integrase core domain-containing protein [Planctomycetota bacterium]